MQKGKGGGKRKEGKRRAQKSTKYKKLRRSISLPPPLTTHEDSLKTLNQPTSSYHRPSLGSYLSLTSPCKVLLLGRGCRAQFSSLSGSHRMFLGGFTRKASSITTGSSFPNKFKMSPDFQQAPPGRPITRPCVIYINVENGDPWGRRTGQRKLPLPYLTSPILGKQFIGSWLVPQNLAGSWFPSPH